MDNYPFNPMSYSIEKIHPFCNLHYTDALAIAAMFDAAKKWWPEIESCYQQWAPDSSESFEDFSNMIDGFRDDAKSIHEELNWHEKNDY